jgi:hypothetical protein
MLRKPWIVARPLSQPVVPLATLVPIRLSIRTAECRHRMVREHSRVCLKHKLSLLHLNPIIACSVPDQRAKLVYVAPTLYLLARSRAGSPFSSLFLRDQCYAGTELMNRFLQPACRSSSALWSLPRSTIRPNIAISQLSTRAMSTTSVPGSDKKPNTWQGAGAAEFDLRSMLQSPMGGLLHTDLPQVIQ